MRVTNIQHTLGGNQLLTPRAQFDNANQLPNGVGAIRLAQRVWCFGVQVMFTFDNPLMAPGQDLNRLNNVLHVGNEVRLERSVRRFVDKAGFQPQRVIPMLSATLDGAFSNYAVHLDWAIDTPNEGNVTVLNNNQLCVFDGPGRLHLLGQFTNPLTGYFEFSIKVSNAQNLRLAEFAFRFFMEDSTGRSPTTSMLY